MSNMLIEPAAQKPSGSRWARWAGECRHHRTEPLEVYRGPWTKEDGLKQTHFPLLLVSNTLDPVTPLEAAVDAQRRFGAFGDKTASVLIQKAYGHCSTSQASRCTTEKIKQYFIDGVLPANGTVCDADKGGSRPYASFSRNECTLTPD